MLQPDFFVLLGLIGMERRRKSAKHLQNINGCGLGRRFSFGGEGPKVAGFHRIQR